MATVPPESAFTTFTAPVPGEPVWDVARLYPPQGEWSEEQYLRLSEGTNRLVEYSNGFIEFLAMPTIAHQLILKFLLRALDAFVEPRKLGMVLFSPLPVWTTVKNYREPDLIFQFAENHAKSNGRYYRGADLLMEVVSEDDRSHKRDHEEKLIEYAKAGVQEYWIVDPQEDRILVMALVGDAYAAHGECRRGDIAGSKLLDGFKLDVNAVFDAAKA